MRGLQVAELGNQVSGWKFNVSVKLILQWLGADHVSFDLNGLDGAVKLDLSQPLPEEYIGKFDVVTNYGTTEHVATTLDLRDQYAAWKNIHDLAKPNAAVIHVVPSESGAHCNCGYVYSHKFFDKLQRICRYELLEFYDSTSDLNHMAALLLKDSRSCFPCFEDFVSMNEILKVTWQ